MEYAYYTVKTLYEQAKSPEVKEAIKISLDRLPYNKLLKNNKKDYFAIDNLKFEQKLLSYYSNFSELYDRYKDADGLTVWKEETIWVPIGDTDRFKLNQDGKLKKELRKEIVRQIKLIENRIDDTNPEYFFRELETYDKFIVDAYFILGEEKLEEFHYSTKKIKEAIILKRSQDPQAVQLIKNSFIQDKRYTWEYIKKELNRIFELLDIQTPNKITAQTLRNYFEVTECKIKNQRSFLIGKPKI